MQLRYLLTFTFMTAIAADDSVKLKFNGQTITSSTLKWFTPGDGAIPEDAVVGSLEYVLAEGIQEQDITSANAKQAIVERKIYVCQANVNGNRIPGALLQKSNGKWVCVVALVKQIYERESFDVLQNVDRAARLLWEEWEKSRDVPNSAVSSGEYCIAHSPSPNFRYISEHMALGTSFLMGKIEPNVGIFGRMSVVTEDNEVLFDISNGQVLVEIEPIMYELNVRKLTTNRRKIVARNETVLGETTLQNGETTLENETLIEMRVDAVIPYAWKYFSSWGTGRAMLKGLPTNVNLLNSTSVENITWGLPYEVERTGIEKVEALLPPGTATRVQLIGQYLEIEIPYTATLLSVFQDSKVMNRTVHGTWRYTELKDIKIKYGPLYFLKNMSLVPTTTTTTTPTPPTTFPTTTMTNEIKTTIIQSTTIGEKRTTSAVKEDMQNDQSAMQLNKKDEPDKTGSATRACISFSSLMVNALLISTVFGYTVNTIT